MAADMSDPKYYGIIGVFWLVVLAMLWKFSFPSEMNLFWIKVIISIVSLPIIGIIVYMMGSD